MTRVTVVGAVNVDLVVVAARLPGPGETVVGPRMTRSGGGKGANAAVAAAAAGASTSLIGAVGDDEDGRFALADLHGRGVDTASVPALDGETTGCALIAVDPHGENQIAVGLGANAALLPATVRAAVAAGPADCILVSTEIPGSCVVAAVESARSSGTRCVLNPAPVIPEVVELLRARPTGDLIITPNAGEAADLARALGLDATEPGAIAEQLSAHTGQTVVVTLGAGGAILAESGSAHLRLPATADVDVVDTTGAGDCFNGFFAAALATGESVNAAVRAGMKAAGESVQWAGARRPLG